MDKVIDTSIGTVTISKDVIASVVRMAATGTYGLAGMSQGLYDGLVGFFGVDTENRGVEINLDGNELDVKLRIVVGYGTRITMVARNVASSVRYLVKERLGITVRRVDIIVEGVRVSGE